MNYKCSNCGTSIDRKHGLCDECREQARILDMNVNRKTDEEIMSELTEKPRSWRDIFGTRKAAR